MLQWARVDFEIGVRTVPAGTLDFVEFGKPDDAKDRARRFLLSAEHAMAEGDYALAAERLIYARDADEPDPTIHRLMTVAFWQSRRHERGRAQRPRLGARRARSPGAAPLRSAPLRGHGTARAGRRGGRAGMRHQPA